MKLASGLVVPWVTLWSGEVIPTKQTVILPSPDGLGYASPRSSDFFMGALWHRELDKPGSGGPVWSQVHGGRQRAAMLEVRCQVCGEKLPATDIPWLMPAKEWQGEFATKRITNTPPTCEECWSIAEARCPHLREKGFVRFYARSLEPWGYLAGLYHPLVKRSGLWVRFGEKVVPHIIAKQLIVKIVDPIREEDYRAPPPSWPADSRVDAYRKQTGRSTLTTKQWKRYKKKARKYNG